MTAVCFKSKNEQKTETWSGVFPDFNTETTSCFFLKQLTTTCISTILYLRKILPEDYFESKNFEGMSLKFLKTGRSYMYVDKIQKWLDGAFDAIDKKYLKHLMLDVKDAESKMTLEIYTITFHYQKEREALNILLSKPETKKDIFSGFSMSNTQLRTIRLLQMCYAVTQTCSSLPSKVTIAIRLSYHDDTPGDYHPIGFKAWQPTQLQFPRPTRSIEIGITGTDHHIFKLVNKSCFTEKFLKNLEDIEDDKENLSPEISQNVCDEKENKNERPTKAKRELCFNSQPSSAESSEKNNDPDEVHNNEKKDLNASNQKTLTSSNSQSKAHEPKIPVIKIESVRCPCLSPIKSQSMFTCFRCRYLVHAECFGILQYDEAKKIRFYCHLCHKTKDEYRCPDKVMISLHRSTDQQKLALLRQVLKVITESKVKKITLKKLEKIAGPNTSKNTVEIILNKLCEIGVTVSQGKKNFLIDEEKLNKNLNHYFYQLKRSSIAQTKVTSQPVRTPEMKRRDMNPGEFYENKKFKKTFPTSLVIDSQQSSQSMSQHSRDIFQC